MRLIMGASTAGINTLKAMEYLISLGLHCLNAANWRIQKTKVNTAIKSTFLEHNVENRQNYTIATRAVPNYCGNVKWQGKDGVEHSTAQGTTSTGGAGCTRIYRERHQCRQTAFIVNSNITGLPLSLIILQVSQI